MFLSPVTLVLSCSRRRKNKIKKGTQSEIFFLEGGGGGVGGGGGGGVKKGKGKKERTFGGVTCLVFSKPCEIFIFNPGHVGVVVGIVLFLGPFRHVGLVFEDDNFWLSLEVFSG